MNNLSQMSKSISESKVNSNDTIKKFTPISAIMVSLIEHPMIKQSHIADKLFLGVNNTNKSKLNKRIKGTYVFTEEEVDKAIRAFDEFYEKVKEAKAQIQEIKNNRNDETNS
jgi:hypothetical protein